MISRYQKAGGFIQLLKLIETCDPQKQKKFLGIIENEDLLWAKAIKCKMLTVERIMSWDDLILGEVAVQLPEKIFASLLHHFGEATGERFYKTLSESQKRKIRNAFEEMKPTPGEINSALIVFVEKVRSLIIEGSLRVDRFDSALAVDKDIEEHLADGSFDASAAPSFETLAIDDMTSSKSSGSAVNAEEVISLKKKIYELSKENQQLKDQNKDLSQRLEKIRQIA